MGFPATMGRCTVKRFAVVTGTVYKLAPWYEWTATFTGRLSVRWCQYELVILDNCGNAMVDTWEEISDGGKIELKKGPVFKVKIPKIKFNFVFRFPKGTDPIEGKPVRDDTEGTEPEKEKKPEVVTNKVEDTNTPLQDKPVASGQLQETYHVTAQGTAWVSSKDAYTVDDVTLGLQNDGKNLVCTPEQFGAIIAAAYARGMSVEITPAYTPTQIGGRGWENEGLKNLGIEAPYAPFANNNSGQLFTGYNVYFDGILQDPATFGSLTSLEQTYAPNPTYDTDPYGDSGNQGVESVAAASHSGAD